MNIRDKIFGQRESKKEMTEKDVIILHEFMMSEYGWIPLEDLMNLPIPTFWNIIRCFNKRKEEEKKQYEKSKRRR